MTDETMKSESSFSMKAPAKKPLEDARLLESSMKTAFTTELGINSFYNKFIEFKSQTRAMQKKIDETLVNTKLSNADKMAKIASMDAAEAT